MAYYEIVEIPGKEKVYPKNGDEPIRNQDEAKIIVNRLRAEAKKDGRKVDFMVRRDTERVAAASAGGTSIRLSEENREMVARFCGRVMMETGQPVSMGDAVAKLATVAKTALDLGIIDYQGNLDEAAVISAAREIRRAQKEATA